MLLLEGGFRRRLFLLRYLLLRYLLNFDGYLHRFLGRLSWYSRGCFPPWRGWGWCPPRRRGSARGAFCGRLPVPASALYVPHPRGTAHSGTLRVSLPSGTQEGLVPSLLGRIQGYRGHALAVTGLAFGPLLPWRGFTTLLSTTTFAGSFSGALSTPFSSSLTSSFGLAAPFALGARPLPAFSAGRTHPAHERTCAGHRSWDLWPRLHGYCLRL